MHTPFPSCEILDRMERAIVKVRERLTRSTAALDRAGVPYAVIGGNAVGAWVAKVDQSAVRNTPNVDLLIRRADLDATIAALESVGFRYQCSTGIATLLDGPDGKPRDAVHLIFAGEKVRQDYAEPAPDVEPYEPAPPYRLLPLGSLVKMKLTSHRSIDQTHLRDLMGVGLIDASWPDRFSEALAARLRDLLANPDG
jgi:hypothetical protein